MLPVLQVEQVRVETRSVYPWSPCFCSIPYFFNRRKRRKQQFCPLLMERCPVRSFSTWITRPQGAFWLPCSPKMIQCTWNDLQCTGIKGSFLLPYLPPSIFFPQLSVIPFGRKAAILLLCWEPSGRFLSPWLEAKVMEDLLVSACSVPASLHSLTPSPALLFLGSVPCSGPLWCFLNPQPPFCFWDFALKVCSSWTVSSSTWIQHSPFPALANLKSSAWGLLSPLLPTALPTSILFLCFFLGVFSTVLDPVHLFAWCQSLASCRSSTRSFVHY